jgi:hypothetical protein
MNLKIDTVLHTSVDYNPRQLLATQNWVAIKEKTYLIKNINIYNTKNLEKLSRDFIFKYGEQELKYYESIKKYELTNKEIKEAIQIEI